MKSKASKKNAEFLQDMIGGDYIDELNSNKAVQFNFKLQSRDRFIK